MYHNLLLKALLMSAPILILGQVTAKKADPTSPTSIDKPLPELPYTSPFGGWFIPAQALEDYEVGLDPANAYGGKFSAYFRSKSDAQLSKAISLKQTIKADSYRRHQVRLVGYLKGKILTDSWAGLWLRVDGKQGLRLSLDNMQNRPLRGTTEWSRYELILDVPENSLAISFGLVLVGQGEVWIDDLSLEILNQRVPTTEVYGESVPGADIEEYHRRRERNAKRLNDELKTMPSNASNLDFEHGKS